MKWKLMSIFTVLVLTLMACQGADNADRGTNNNPNIDPTTNRNTGDGIFNNDQDYMFQRGDNERGYGNNNRMNNRNSRYDIAEEAAERITDEIDEIENAYVLTTENNAYVAAQLDNDRNNRGDRNNRNRGDRTNQDRMNRNNNHFGDDEISNRLKERIAKVVQSVDRDIENVYVSTNPDFLNLVNDYADDTDNGRPIGGFFDQLEVMIERIFPENAGR